MKRIFLFLAASLFLFKIALVSTGCANIIPPQGGPRDSLPPVLLKSTPLDSTLNFNGSRISFSFDEFVEIQNVAENLLVSPIPKNNPSVDYKLNTISIRLKDSLEANTTYSINFGNAIKDYNEGNVLKNFTYTFSTGAYLDSLELKGKVILAETGKVDTTLIVLLHTQSGDSAVVKEKPRYIVKLDSKGMFHFKNLPAKTFYIYTLKDETGTRRYLKEDQLFGFADKPVNPQNTSDSITLSAYSIPAPIKGPGSSISNLNRGNGALKVERLRYQTTITNGQQDLLTRFMMTFENPLRIFDSLKMRLYRDSTFIPDTAYRFTRDSSSKKITLFNIWKENTQYHIILDQDFATDTAGRKLPKSDTLSFTTKKAADYGSIKIKFRNLELARNPVLQFLVTESIVKSVPLSSADFAQQLFIPGEYELRILFDENKNGVWDPGNFFKNRRQPEKVLPLSRRIVVKPAWPNEFEIVL